MGTSPVRVTTAGNSPAEDIRHRQRRYLVSMAIRTVCFIGAVAVGPGALRWVLVAGAVLLPYVAVVLANKETRRDDGYQVTGPGPGPELPAPSHKPLPRG